MACDALDAKRLRSGCGRRARGWGPISLNPHWAWTHAPGLQKKCQGMINIGSISARNTRTAASCKGAPVAAKVTKKSASRTYFGKIRRCLGGKCWSPAWRTPRSLYGRGRRPPAPPRGGGSRARAWTAGRRQDPLEMARGGEGGGSKWVLGVLFPHLRGEVVDVRSKLLEALAGSPRCSMDYPPHT